MKIWDLPTRLYHWLQALLFTLLALSGFFGNGPHELFGLALATLLAWRVLWGFFGSETSRFRQFVRSPKTVINYLNGGHSHHGVGHNPAGGWMVITLLSLLLAQCFVGLSMGGYFDAYIHEDSLLYDMDLLISVHATLAYLLLACVALHLLAIVIYNLRGKPLVKAMLTGKQPALTNTLSVFFRSNIRAGILLASIGGLISVFLYPAFA
ncbi:hydrogenase [Enterovibrio norvegicus FF-33]|uniref:Hydrogenase n=1 Tax=Enterovibrio norvegicus FF-454 TaxID=1185651 RepID=A0A1E5C0G5_9GAMM|nr:cytochrome b/b6 domain-containing protein [Enterovibrio norvegicus]OEE59018.1 hydrogenase [Enterovibrio norvegicus FF-454]OEE67826.1 hydrogenase [Enterovibrio norvegicus FF-33]OEE85909.1 hydrogenase [Enterovibrio norvegicus FF-162]